MTTRVLKNQKGLTLIELMIALTLSLLLLAGVIQVFLANKQSYRMTEAHARLQENARFALDILTRDVRGAGYSGCRTIENVEIITVANSPVPAVMDANTIITGVDNYTTSPVSNLGAVVTGTDSITLMLGDSCGGNLTGNVTSSNANIQIVNPNNCNISAGDVVLISDCETGHVFRANNAPNSDSSKQTVTHPSSTNQTSHLCKSYNSPITDGACNKGQQKIYSFDAEIYRFRAYTYFIRNGANGQPALWRYDSTANASGANPIELIEDIENMQITYGLDTNDDDILDSYANATTVTTANQWDKVISARVSLLAKTAEENLTIDGQTVSYNGADVSCEDGSLCRVFTSTIGIRNRVQ